MKFKAFGQTDVGLKRQKNEDSILVEENLGLFIVADGMGGHVGGELASRMAVESLKEVVSIGLEKQSAHFNAEQAMRLGFKEACRSIYHKSHVESPELKGMGTTLVSALIHNGVITIANVGDSRAYLVRGDRMWQLTEDHSLLNEHIRAGLLKDSEADKFQAKNVITRSVGFESEVDCDILQKKLEPGDRIMLCSDGLCGLVSPDYLSGLCLEQDLQKACEICIEEAKNNGGDDNISVLFIDII